MIGGPSLRLVDDVTTGIATDKYVVAKFASCKQRPASIHPLSNVCSSLLQNTIVDCIRKL